MTDSLIAIVPAAGIGARASTPGADAIPKQYRSLAGLSMLRHAVLALLAEPRIAHVVVAVSSDDGWVEQTLKGLPRTLIRRCGGPTRAATVANALDDSTATDGNWVLVHDAARPGLPLACLSALIDACVNDPVGGLLALPVADTVKSGEERVNRTIDRSGLWLAQTPQMFRAGALRQALLLAASQAAEVTDEASAMEAAGYAPRLVRGAMRNFKVTWPEDFGLMEKWL
jgi:2-C-methyl-D-erythritol 4-phosphate cytidylyltransferase